MRNYIGQLRLYSLVDLALLLIATDCELRQGMGVICLWIAFLIYLESRHQHEYRKPWPSRSWLLIGGMGLVLLNRLEGMAYVFATIAYVKKKEYSGYALAAPLSRGLQSLFLVGGLIGHAEPLAWMAGGLTVLRNLIGDWRDVGKDRDEEMRTIPVVLGWPQPWPYMHLVAVMTTSTVWWHYTSLDPMWLLATWVIQISTYNITPR